MQLYNPKKGGDITYQHYEYLQEFYVSADQKVLCRRFIAYRRRIEDNERWRTIGQIIF